MTNTSLPRHDELGPDPEPVGVRGEQLMDRATRPRTHHPDLSVAGGIRGRIIIARLGVPASPRDRVGGAS